MEENEDHAHDEYKEYFELEIKKDYKDSND